MVQLVPELSGGHVPVFHQDGSFRMIRAYTAAECIGCATSNCLQLWTLSLLLGISNNHTKLNLTFYSHLALTTKFIRLLLD
uniref:Uncharacterized protein n=1 Tax=Meloidogyne incognita TaxID=6306 RepID=A0A914MYJ1_MELIC